MPFCQKRNNVMTFGGNESPITVTAFFAAHEKRENHGSKEGNHKEKKIKLISFHVSEFRYRSDLHGARVHRFIHSVTDKTLF